MKLIVSADDHWGIGRGGRLMVRIPEDLARFKALTWGHTVVMGRRTLETLPGGKPLKGRTNIVLSRQSDLNAPGAVHARSLDEALAYIERTRDGDIFVIGGQTVYEHLLPYCTEAYVTRWSRGLREEADAFFPNLDALPQWVLAETSEEQRHGAIRYRYLTYRSRGI